MSNFSIFSSPQESPKLVFSPLEKTIIVNVSWFMASTSFSYRLVLPFFGAIINRLTVLGAFHEGSQATLRLQNTHLSITIQLWAPTMDGADENEAMLL